MSVVPQIETPRLILRAHREADHEPATDLWQRPEVYRFITGEPLSVQDVWLRLLRYGGLWDYLGYGYWAVEERESGRYVGQMGFANFKRGLVGFDGHYPEAGWVIHPDAAGCGYATEGMQGACQWLDQQPRWERSFCIIGRGNERSVRVANKLGYAYKLDTMLGEEPTGVFFRERPLKPRQP